MDSSEQARFDVLYAQHLRALKLQGKATATIDSYARAVRRVAAYFDRCPDQLDSEDFKTYFAALIDTRSWSLVKIERCGLQFFYQHVLGRDWPWVEMLKPPKVQSLPDVLTIEEIARIIWATRPTAGVLSRMPHADGHCPDHASTAARSVNPGTRMARRLRGPPVRRVRRPLSVQEELTCDERH